MDADQFDRFDSLLRETHDSTIRQEGVIQRIREDQIIHQEYVQKLESRVAVCEETTGAVRKSFIFLLSILGILATGIAIPVGEWIWNKLFGGGK